MEGNTRIIGEAASPPKFFHLSEGKKLLTFNVNVRRNNQEIDCLPVFIEEEKLVVKIKKGTRVEVKGNIRKYKYHKLHTGIMATEVLVSDKEDTNKVEAVGRVLESPKAKKTEKNLLFVKVPIEVYCEENSSSEYLTLFAVGDMAKYLNRLEENQQIAFIGNLQFRKGKGDGKRYFEVKVYYFKKN